MRTPNEIIDDIERIRASNNGVWMKLVRLAWEIDPTTAQAISAEITENDAKILECSRELAEIDQSKLGAQAAQYVSERKAVILPGGGVLHTYAVHEALALGLTPIVTDRDPKCPCAKIKGVEFNAIDCYDTEAHLELLRTRKSDDIIGAFCGGADTHVQVAAVHDALVHPGRWVMTKTAEKCKDKLLTKQALQAHGVPTANLLYGGGQILAAVYVQGKAIWKPTNGSGSVGVRRYVPGDAPMSSNLFVEELLEGPEQSVEILLGPNGRGINIVDRYFAWVDGQPLEWGHTNPSRLDDETKNALYKLAFSAAHAVGADVGFFKIDSILTKDGPKVLECTPRLSGGWDSQLSTPRSSGRNLLRYGLQLACGLPLEEGLLGRTRDETVTIIHRPELASAE